MQSYLTKRLGKARFLKSYEWPPSSPDLYVLDYYFWNALSKKFYEGRRERPLKNEEQLKMKIRI